MARQNIAFKTPSGLRGPTVKTIIMVGHNVNLWRNHDPSKVFDVRNIRRLILAGCRDPIFVPWQAYPSGLEVLEILDPVPSYPIGAGLYLREQQLARPLSHFTRLNVLNLQNVGAPICEVLFHLQESGTSLKVLKLHDQEVSGIDMCYKFRPQHPRTTDIACFFLKLLAYLCPNLQTLSLDISSHGLEQDHPMVHHRCSDSYSAILEPMLEEVARYPTLSLSETFRSLRDLQSLRLVTPFSPAMCKNNNALRYAEKLWSKSLKNFTLVASASADGKCVGSLDASGDYKLIPGSQLEWCVKSRGSNDTTGRENNYLYLVEGL
ncbi:MAG: hypothetical protein LQ337_005868 [Flavoplaca oasis]|nr:MAG: hypothetical protein LQ337_005868 [Flavoplaca oasis]